MCIIRWLGFFLSITAVLALLVVIGLYGTFRDEIPKVLAVKDYRPIIKSRVFAQNGELIAEFGTHERIVTKWEALPPLIIKAFISSEDKNFYRHHGIDFKGVLNSVIQSVTGQRSTLRGASTITQQLAKSLLVKEEGYEQATARTVSRKIKEAILSRRLEMHLAKNDILWMYLNEVYLGHGSYGVAAAAKNYFRKTLNDLSLGEIAIIAGLPQAPSRFSPQINMNAALARQGYVLGRMLEDGYISQAEHDGALRQNATISVHERENSFRKAAPYFSETVRRMLIDEFGEKRVYEDGLNIYTTLNLEHEQNMQRVLKHGLIEIDKRQGYLGPIFRPADENERQRARQIVEKVNAEDLLQLGARYRLAMIERIDTNDSVILIDLGTERGVIPRVSMAWARPREQKSPTEPAKREPLFLPHDVVIVKSNAPHEPSQKNRGIFSLEQEPLVEGAMIAIEQASGYVTAMNGGYSFDRSEFNRVYQACRQPGSLFKPVVYSAAIALKKFTPATLVMDTPLTFYDANSESTWKPKNFGNHYKGEVTVREALMKSMNIPTLNLTAQVGVDNILSWAKKLGIETKLKPELGVGIGSSCVTEWELSRVFAAIANLGKPVEPTLIKEITDRDHARIMFQGHKSDQWIRRGDRVTDQLSQFFGEEKRVMSVEDAYTMHYLLTEVAKHGTASRTNALGLEIAGKTGTTNDSYDTWFAGYSKHLMALVWVGNDTMDVPLNQNEQGARTALPLFSQFISSAVGHLLDQRLEMPRTMCTARIDGKTGLRVVGDHPQSFVAPFRCGEEPPLLESRPNQSLEQAMEVMGISL